MNFKRKKCKRKIRCSLCTPFKWLGNTKERFSHKDKRVLTSIK